ncbi:MAG: AI-2E family transporter [Bacteroidales bacterium]|jgi:predicted PurR-regulated permease PerM|nr:AI-2E family transporter [Bacteroidales bacterium]
MSKFQKIILICIAIVSFFLFITYLGNVFIWLLLSLFLCIIGLPIENFLSKLHIRKLKIPKMLSSILTIGLILGIIFVAFRFFIPLIVDEIVKFQSLDIETISEQLEQPIKTIEDFIVGSGFIADNNFSLETSIVDSIHNLLNFSTFTVVFNNVGGPLMQVFLALFSIIFISFFFLKDKDSIINSLLSFTSREINKEVFAIIKSIKHLLIRYFYGVIIEMLFFVIFCTIGFCIVGVNFGLALLIGIIIGVLNIIPYVGPCIATVFGLVLVSLGNLNLGLSEVGLLDLKFLIVVVIAEIIDNIFLQSLIYSKSIKVHPVEIYLVIIIAGSFYGILGMMFAIPVYSIVRVIALSIFEYNKPRTNEILYNNIKLENHENL